MEFRKGTDGEGEMPLEKEKKGKGRMLRIIIAVGIFCAAAVFLFLYRWKLFPGGEGGETAPEAESREYTDGSNTYYASPAENIVTEGGYVFVNNEILVTLQEPGEKEELMAYLAEIGGELVGELPKTGDCQILLDRACTYRELETLAEDLESRVWVKRACSNYAFKLDNQYIPNDSRWAKKWDDIPKGENWWLEAIEAPAAWENLDEMQDVNVGIFDDMFDVSHNDLQFADPDIPFNSIPLEKAQDNSQNWSDHGTHVAGIIGASFDNGEGIAGTAPTASLYAVSKDGLNDEGYDTVAGFKYPLAYLIDTNSCRVVNISMAADVLTFNASRGDETAIKCLEVFANEMGEYIADLSEYCDFVICKAAGNQNEVGGSYQYFLRDEDDKIADETEDENADETADGTEDENDGNGEDEAEGDDENNGVNDDGSEYPFQYYPYSDYPDNVPERYQGRKKEIKARLRSGNVDAKFDIFGAITNKKAKSRIIIVGAAENLGSHREGGFLCFGGTKVHDGYKIAAFSQCGERVDVLAPGVNVCSTVQGGYDSLSGTSMASPVVAGVAAMCYAVNPDLSGDDVKRIIVETATGEYGEEKYGLVNARAAVERAIVLKPPEPGEGRTAVLALDTSFSMYGEPIEKLKEAAESFLDAVPEENATVWVVPYADTNSQLEKWGPGVGREAAREGIQGLYASWGGTDTGSALQEARTLLNRQEDDGKKIIVLMSDGLPNQGMTVDGLIAYADMLKEKGILIYTIGFFEKTEEYTQQAQNLMESLASEGCYYEVTDEDELVYVFGDVADLVSGQKYICVRIACPVEVSVTYGGQTLSSAEESQCLRTDFGTLSIEETEGKGSEGRVKILRLKEGADYRLELAGTARGVMDYTVGFMDEDGAYTDFRTFDNVEITDRTRIDTTVSVSPESELYIDEDGNGTYDRLLRTDSDGVSEETELEQQIGIPAAAKASGILALLVLLAVIMLLILIFMIKKHRIKRKKENREMEIYCTKCGARLDNGAVTCSQCGAQVNEGKFTPEEAGETAGYAGQETADSKTEKKKRDIRFWLILVAILAVLLAAAAVAARFAFRHTGNRNLARIVMTAYRDYDIDTLVQVSSEIYYFENDGSDYLDNYYRESVGAGIDDFEDSLGYEYKFSYEVTDIHDLSKRATEKIMEKLAALFPDYDADFIDTVSVAEVTITAKNGDRTVNREVEITMTKEGDGWRLLFLE